LAVFPALLHAVVLALLSAAVPMKTTATSTVVAVLPDGTDNKLAVAPDPREVRQAQSLHMFTFTSTAELLLAESEGDFTMLDWDRSHAKALEICCDSGGKSGIDMTTDETQRQGPSLFEHLRGTTETKVKGELWWK
jgi:exosome complex component RRP46